MACSLFSTAGRPVTVLLDLLVLQYFSAFFFHIAHINEKHIYYALAVLVDTCIYSCTFPFPTGSPIGTPGGSGSGYKLNDKKQNSCHLPRWLANRDAKRFRLHEGRCEKKAAQPHPFPSPSPPARQSGRQVGPVPVPGGGAVENMSSLFLHSEETEHLCPREHAHVIEGWDI